MKRQELKKPSDYPPFAFRLNNERQKRLLNKEVKATMKEVNSGLTKTQKKYTKSDVIFTALLSGLNQIRDKKIKLNK